MNAFNLTTCSHLFSQVLVPISTPPVVSERSHFDRSLLIPGIMNLFFKNLSSVWHFPPWFRWCGQYFYVFAELLPDILFQCCLHGCWYLLLFRRFSLDIPEYGHHLGSSHCFPFSHFMVSLVNPGKMCLPCHLPSRWMHPVLEKESLPNWRPGRGCLSFSSGPSHVHGGL